MAKSHRLLSIAALLFPVLWGVGWILLKSFPDYPPGNDSCLYLTMAKGLAQGTGYHDVTSPDPHAGTLQSPSFWPLMLSLYWRLPNPHLSVLRLANAIILCGATIPCFFWLRIFLPALPAFLIVMALASSWVNVFLGNSFMTETVFLPLLYGGLLVSHHGLASGGDAKRAGAMRWLAVLLWTVGARTRVVGWIFWGTYLFLLGRRKEWPKVAAGLALMGAWLLMEKRMAAGIRVSQYLDGMFTEKYPILVNLKAGFLTLVGNLKATLWNWSTGGEAHAMFPWLYYAHPMDRAKRLACAALFLAVLWGLVLVWRRHREIRPWILAAVAACAPTFGIYHPGDTWRYMHPFLPLSCLFLMAAIGGAGFSAGQGSAAGAGGQGGLFAGMKAGRVRWMAAVGLIMVLTQALHSYQRDMDDDYIDQSRDFRALHDSILAAPVKPAFILSPDHYYTWLRTGIPCMNNYGRQQQLPDVIPYLKRLDTWAIRGSANAYFTDPWERKGVYFQRPPLLEVRQWQAFKAEWRGE